MAPGKRKRNDRSSVDSGESRPSPHRPGNSNLGQHDREFDMRDNRRSSRGGGVRGGRRPDGRRDSNHGVNPNSARVPPRATPAPGPGPGPISPSNPPASATQTPAATLNTPMDKSSPAPRSDPAPFDYEFITSDRVSSWHKSGSKEVVDVGIQAKEAEDTVELSFIFQELIRAALDGRINAADAGSCVKEILGPDTSPDESSDDFDPQTLFLDTLSMVVDAEDGPSSTDLRNFTTATQIPPLVMRQKLDAQVLQSLALTRDTFIRVGIRQATNLLYKQANYNLLREETEGYAKLVTELFSISGSEPPSAEVVEDAFEKVKGLIGTFDLDVGRVLDITLDVFAAVLIKHYRFFIKFLRVSSWWPRNGETDSAAAARCAGLPKWALPTSQGWLPTEEDEEISKQQRYERDIRFWDRAREIGLDAFFELGGRQIIDEETKLRLLNGKGNDAKLDADHQWIEDTGTLPPSGNRIAAQLLGFKLRFYASAARDKDDILPSNLIYLTALLIKVGFISLKDLYAHLWPLDEDMPAVREAKRKELEEKERLNRPGGGAANALMMAGALVDDMPPPGTRTREIPGSKPDVPMATAEAEDEEKVEEPADQKVQLLVCLLTIGALPEALFILGRFPWIPEAYPEVYELINRILNHSIKDVYENSRPSASQDFESPTKPVVDYDQSSVPKGQVRTSRLPTRKQLRWPFPDKWDTNESNCYRFYWDEWADNIPICQNVDDLFTLCGSLLNFSGVNIGRDPFLLSRLARIGTQSLTEDHTPSNLARWEDLLKRLLVPSLSLTKSNTSVVNEIYDMLRFYPVSIRYSIYAEWFEGQISRLPTMKVAFARTRLETLATMKRISKTNLTAMARSLAKTAYASPGIVFGVALSQIEAYTNLTEVVVECAKYFTDLGYDVLVWSLMSSLGGKDRNRNNAEFALLPSRWLLALSRFSGKVFKRYSIMNLSPIIQYVNHQLYRGNSTDLVILKELISQMAGVVPDTDFNDAQIAAMTGGELLRRQTLINLQDKRYESTKTAQRLVKALSETRLAGPLLLSIAQHRQSAIYGISDEEAHIKLLATMIDDAQLILFQYLDFLRSNFSVEEFDEHVPGIAELITSFGLDPALAFLIGRTSLASRMAKISPAWSNGVSKSSPAANDTTMKDGDGDGDVAMEPALLESGTIATESKDTEMAVEEIEKTVAKDHGSPQAIAIADSQISSDPYQDILEPVINAVEAALPEGSWATMSPRYYVTFWLSTLGDLSIPSASYEAEIARLLKEETEVQKDRTDMTRAGMARKEEAKKALMETRQNILGEYGKQVGMYKQTKARLLKHKGTWFAASSKAEAVSDAFLERCLIPRLLLSPTDADFCFRMLRFLHDNNTYNFRTLSVYTQLFRANRLRSLIFTCTVREAENLGRFLKLALADLARWHTDKAVYEKEAWGANADLPGFAVSVTDEFKPKALIEHEGGKSGFKSVLLHWHKNVNTALRDCLEGTEWMHIRNAISVLKTVVEVFPAVDFMGNNFMKQLEVITKREKGVREDLSLTGNAVLVQLKKRSKSWMMVQAFASNINEPGQTSGAAAKGATPTATTSKTMLKPTAPEFKPQSRANSTGVSTPKPHEVEDGEVDDKAKPANLHSQSTGSANRPESSFNDVSSRREATMRENSSKASSPAPSQSGIPYRADALRALPGSIINDRANPNLPSRPELPFPSRHQFDRHPTRDRRDGRDSRVPDPNRLERGERPRDFSGNDRRGVDVPQRDYSRSADRNIVDRPSRIIEPPPRWTAPHDNLDRATTNGVRLPDNSGRLSRETEMPPPRPSAPNTDRGPLVNPERLALVNAESQESINPERAALISGGNEVRINQNRVVSQDTNLRPGSRPQSPRRHGMDRDEGRRDNRLGHHGPDSHSSRGRYDDIQPPPAGPRSERNPDRPGDRGVSDRPRDASAFQPSPVNNRVLDPSHGRLNSGGRQPDPNFGRLNAVSTGPDIPSGPRDRHPNGRTNRMVSAPQQRRDAAPPQEIPRPPTPEKHPPTGPSAARGPRRSASGQYDNLTGPPVSLPSTPGAASPASTVHPDRLKHLGAQVVTAPQSPVTPGPPTGIHPDRLKAFNESAGNSSPGGQSGGRSRPPGPPIRTTPSAAPPSGPKFTQPSPTGSAQHALAPPTGPASANDRGHRGNGGQRQLNHIQTFLQQAGQQSTPNERVNNIRGRGGRVNSMNQPSTPVSGPSTPSSVPPPPLGPPPQRTEAKDISMVNPARADLITGQAVVPDERSHGHGDRSSRHQSRHQTRRGSKSPDHGRESKRVPGEEDPTRSSRREHRDRGGTDREGGRERHSTRDPAASHDLIGNRESGGSVKEGGRERERDSSRRHGSERDRGREAQEGSWPGAEKGAGGRSRDIRGEERRESRDGGRKRHSEGDALDGRGREKRPRR